MAGFTKLHQAILHSSVWSQPHHVRVVWVTMLAMANADGLVEASTSGLARAANVTLEECREALELLMGPDDESRDGTSGERVTKVEGGFFLLNYANYRDRQTKQQAAAAERMRRVRERSRTCAPVAPSSTEAEAEAEAEAVQKKPAKASRRAAARPDDVSESVWADWKAHRQRKRATTSETVVKTLRRQAAEARMDLQQAMELQIANGWQGFRADWVETKEQKEKRRHIPNLPLGAPSCMCDNCVDYRAKQGGAQ